MSKITWKRVWDVIAVVLIFGCTGSAAAFVSGRVSAWLGLVKWSLPWWVAWILLIFPLYQILLLGFAFVFGKYAEFRARQVRVLRSIKRRLTGHEKAELPEAKG